MIYVVGAIVPSEVPLANCDRRSLGALKDPVRHGPPGKGTSFYVVNRSQPKLLLQCPVRRYNAGVALRTFYARLVHPAGEFMYIVLVHGVHAAGRSKSAQAQNVP